MIDDDDELEEDTGPVRLWPAVVALVVAALVAPAVAVLALTGADEDEPAARAEQVMRVVLVAPSGGGVVRLVTAEPGCRQATRATADLRADAIAFTVYGRDPGGGCAAGVKVRCSELVLPQAVGPRRVLPNPVARYRAEAERQLGGAPCPRIPVAT